MLKQWGRVWAIGFVLWTVLALLSATGAHVYTASMGSPESWAQLLAWSVTVSFIWSLLTPPVYELGPALHLRSQQLDDGAAAPSGCLRGADLRRCRRHRAARSAGHLDAGEARSVSSPHTLSRAFMDFQRYWYIVLITQAIAYYGKYRERELQSSQLEAQLALCAARGA